MGKMKESVAWRREWPIRLTREVAAAPVRRYDEFFDWWRRGITGAIDARLDSIEEGSRRAAYLHTLEARWLLRDERLYERLGIPRSLWPGLSSFVADVFDRHPVVANRGATDEATRRSSAG